MKKKGSLVVLVLCLSVTSCWPMESNDTPGAEAELSAAEMISSSPRNPVGEEEATVAEEHVSVSDPLDVDTFFTWLLELKFHTILAFYIAIQISYDDEDWYGDPTLWTKLSKGARCGTFKFWANDLFLLKLLDNLHCLDLLLYSHPKNEALVRNNLPFFIRAAYEVGATLLPVCGRWENCGMMPDEDNTFRNIKSEYEKSSWQYIFVRVNDGDEYPYFKEVAWSVTTLRVMLDVSTKLFAHIFEVLPFIRKYPCLPQGWRELMFDSHENVRREVLSCPWYKTYQRERVVSDWCTKEGTFFPAINLASFNALFTWLRMKFSRGSAEYGFRGWQEKAINYLRRQPYAPFERQALRIMHIVEPSNG